jgi:hypothetical protein
VKQEELLTEINDEMIIMQTHIRMFYSSFNKHVDFLKIYNIAVLSLPNANELRPTIERDDNNRDLLKESLQLIWGDMQSILELEKKLYD